MTQTPSRTAEFDAQRSRLFGLAYRMLGSRAEAEDVLQDAYIRWYQAGDAIDNPEAWLVTTTTRLAIDRLRRLQTERQAYTGPWLPEPLVAGPPRPDRALELADDLSVAFLTMLERLAPDERAALLLHDVFDVDYGRIAAVLNRSEAACRQVVHRARERVRGPRKRFEADDQARMALLRRFQAAVDARDEQAVLALFAPDATWTADGGGKVAASPRPIVGAERIAKVVIGISEKFWKPTWRLELATVNGEAGLCIRDGGRLVSVLSIETDGDRILNVYAIVNPDKLGEERHDDPTH
ncbi:MAG: RNA polymerase sigma factor SigJ [Vicinamibacterales bacterium]